MRADQPNSDASLATLSSSAERAASNLSNRGISATRSRSAIWLTTRVTLVEAYASNHARRRPGARLTASGKLPRTTRSASSARLTARLSTIASGERSITSRTLDREPASSISLNGHSSMTSTRPTNASAISGTDSSRADPVSTKRPGRRSASTAAFTARNSRGSSCASSITRVSTERSTKVRGSIDAARRVGSWSSVSTSTRPGSWSRSVTRVDFPTCRAPLTTTTGVSVIAALTRGTISRSVVTNAG